MEVIVEPKAFKRADSGAITGPIWVQHEGINFPESGWRDFPVVVLAWWLQNLAGLAHGTKHVVCRFMDGPFEFTVTSEPPDLVRLGLAARRTSDPFVLSEFTVAVLVLEQSFQTAAAMVLAECERHGWADRDIETLRAVASTGEH